MKILQIHRRFQIEGGAERYFFSVSKLLKQSRHKIAFFSMNGKKNYHSVWSKYFVSTLLLKDKSLCSRLHFAEQIIFFREARRDLKELLNAYYPEIAHIHNLNLSISPSILPIIKQSNIPIVHTVHDYHFIAPTFGNLFHNGQICEITKKRKYYKALFHRCASKYFFLNTVYVIAQYIQCLFHLYDYVDYFVSPSIFMRNKLIEYGFDPKKIIILHHFIDYQNYLPNYEIGNYILYFGRVAEEKGLNYLVKAIESLPKIKLIIAGTGIVEYLLELKILSSRLKNVKFIGFQREAQLKKLIAESRFTILPSIWYEVFGLSMIESFASGKPVIASNIGGIPEIVINGYNGYLCKPGDIDDLREKINMLWNNPQLCKKLGKNAREYIENNFGPEQHYERLMEIYKKAISNI